MRLSDKMTQTRHVLDDAYEGLGDEITNAMNEMFSYGEEAERKRIIKLLEQNVIHYGCAWDCPQPCTTPTFSELIALIKGEQK
jgi:hypothetical protein